MSDNLLQLYNEFIDQIKPENIQDAHVTRIAGESPRSLVVG